VPSKTELPAKSDRFYSCCVIVTVALIAKVEINGPECRLSPRNARQTGNRSVHFSEMENVTFRSAELFYALWHL